MPFIPPRSIFAGYPPCGSKCLGQFSPDNRHKINKYSKKCEYCGCRDPNYRDLGEDRVPVENLPPLGKGGRRSRKSRRSRRNRRRHTRKN